MLENSRLLFVVTTVCAAVMSFIMCSDAARASPITTQVDKAVEHNVLGRYYAPDSHRYLLSTGMPSAETGLQTGTSHTGMKSHDGETSSIIYRSKPLVFTSGSLSYNQNIPDNRLSLVTGVQSEGKPASNAFSSLSHHGGQSTERLQSAANGRLLYPKVAQSGNSYHSHPVIIRKSSNKGAASPFQQHSPPQIWGPQDAQKSYTFEKVQRNEPLKVTEDHTFWQAPDKPLISSQISRFWSASPTSAGHQKVSPEVTAVGSRITSNGIQSSTIPSFAIPNAPAAPSIGSSSSVGNYAVKRNQRPEKLTSPATDFSQGLDSMGSSGTPGLRKAQSYLFKDSSVGLETVKGDRYAAFSTTPYMLRPSVAPVHSTFSSNFPQSKTEESVKDIRYNPNNDRPLYSNANVAQYGAQTGSFTKYQRPTEAVSPGTDVKGLVPVPPADLQGNYATSSKKSVVRDPFRTTARGSVHTYNPGETTKSMYGFRGFKNPVRKAEKEPAVLPSSGSNDRTNSRRYSTDNGKFTVPNIHPSLPPKYIFGQRQTSSTTVRPERRAIYYSTPSPATVKTRNKPRSFITGFKGTRPLMPKNDAGMDSKPDQRHYRIHRRIYGLKGFGPRPLEGAKPAVGELGKFARVHQSVERSQMNKTDRQFNKIQPASKHIATVHSDEQHNVDLKSAVKTPTGNETSRFTPNRYKSHNKHTNLGLHPIQKRIANATSKTYWRYKEENPATRSATHRFPSVYFRSPGEYTSRTPYKAQPGRASLLNSSTSSTVIGQRVRGEHTNIRKVNGTSLLSNGTRKVNIVRLPGPVRVKPVKYADILGSASFSGVRVTNQTRLKPADKDYFPNITAVTSRPEAAAHSGDNMTRGGDARDEGDSEDSKPGVRGEDNDVKAPDLFLDNEGSGSGNEGFNASDLLPDTAKSWGLREDLSEQDYLRLSTGNVSFKSMKLADTVK